MIEFKIFGAWTTKDVSVEDPGLRRYISLDPVLVPRSSGRNANQRFSKSKSHIVERLMNKLMVPGHKGKKHHRTSGHMTGKAINVYNSVKKCFEIIEHNLKQNPVGVFVKALENASPREEITTIEYGGARYPQAVDCAPQRRIDIALRQFTQGAYNKSFGSKKSLSQALADEILAAYRAEQAGSQAIAKKLELERQAASSR